MARAMAALEAEVSLLLEDDSWMMPKHKSKIRRGRRLMGEEAEMALDEARRLAAERRRAGILMDVDAFFRDDEEEEKERERRAREKDAEVQRDADERRKKRELASLQLANPGYNPAHDSPGDFVLSSSFSSDHSSSLQENSSVHESQHSSLHDSLVATMTPGAHGRITVIAEPPPKSGFSRRLVAPLRPLSNAVAGPSSLLSPPMHVSTPVERRHFRALPPPVIAAAVDPVRCSLLFRDGDSPARDSLAPSSPTPLNNRRSNHNDDGDDDAASFVNDSAQEENRAMDSTRHSRHSDPQSSCPLHSEDGRDDVESDAHDSDYGDEEADSGRVVERTSDEDERSGEEDDDAEPLTDGTIGYNLDDSDLYTDDKESGNVSMRSQVDIAEGGEAMQADVSEDGEASMRRRADTSDDRDASMNASISNDSFVGPSASFIARRPSLFQDPIMHIENVEKRPKNSPHLFLLKPSLVRKEAVTPGVRRSSRVRLPRLASHMNQRPIYSTLPDGTVEIVGIADVEVKDKEMKKYRTIDPLKIAEEKQREKRLAKKNAERKLQADPKLQEKRARKAALHAKHREGFNLTQSSDDLENISY